jgi:hypothetical protein
MVDSIAIMPTRTKGQEINIAVPRRLHQTMKREAANRGMKLKEFSAMLIHLWEVVPDIYRADARQRYELRKR